MRRSLVFSAVALLAIAALSGCGGNQTATDTTASSDSLLASNPVEQPSGSITPSSDYNQPQSTPGTSAPATKPASQRPATRPTNRPSTKPAAEPGVRVDAGTPLNVAVDTQLSSESANVGDTWSGTLKENVIVGDRVVFPAGSVVSGVVTEAQPAGGKGKLARLGFSVTSISANGHRVAVDAGTETIEAGSARARNLGAIAASAGAGALIGKAVGGSGKGALIGGLIGGAAAGAAVAKSKGYQVVIKEGTVVTFNVKQPVTVRT